MLILSVACIYNGSDLVQLWIPHQSQLHLLCQQRLPKLLQQHRPVLDHHREGQPRGTENRLEIILQTNRRAQTPGGGRRCGMAARVAEEIGKAGHQDAAEDSPEEGQ